MVTALLAALAAPLKISGAAPAMILAEASDQSPAALPSAIGIPAETVDPRLPDGVPMRITIRHTLGNAPARQRASELSLGLTQQGLDVVALVTSPERIATNVVSYFYAEDKPGAEIAAHALGSGWTVAQRRLAPREAMPRPGTIELAVAGP